MTGKDGQMLPDCAANVATLKESSRQLGESVSQLWGEMKEVRSTMARHSVTVENIEKNITEKLDQLPGMIRTAVDEEYANCPLLKAMRNKTEEEIAALFSTPKKDSSKSKMSPTLQKAVIGLIVAVTSAITAWVASGAPLPK